MSLFCGMRILGRLFFFVLLAVSAGFFAFVLTLPSADRFDPHLAADELSDLPTNAIGMVVPTGGGGQRIEQALALYSVLKPARILISGTHPDVRIADLAERFDRPVLECCVDLGKRAQTTIGNATEARDWAAAHEYQAIYLVTHDYHLPRATLELRAIAPDLQIVGVPVATHHSGGHWYQSGKSWTLLGKEYLKFLLSAIRTVM